MSSPLRALLVEDSANDAELTVLELRRAGYSPTVWRVETGQALVNALDSQTWDVILCDYSLPGFSAPEALELVQARGLDIPFIIVSGSVGEEAAVMAMKAGAHDYVMKTNLARLGAAVQRETREALIRAERNHSERVLKDSESRFRSLIEDIPDFVIVHREERVVYINPPTAVALGYNSVQELMGQSIWTFVHRDEWSRIALRFQTIADTGRPTPMQEQRWLRRDGSILLVEASGQSLRFSGYPSTLVVARDISQRQELAQKMMMMDRLIAIGTLAAGVAHEINNPLAYVIGNLSFLERQFAELHEAKPDALREQLPEINQVLSEVREGAERVRQVVLGLKTFSRGDHNAMGPVDLRAVIESSIRMAGNETRHRAKVVTEYTHECLAHGNESRLGQVFLNLLVNAAQAIPEGVADTNEIRVSTRRRENRMEVEIRDSGTGIAPDILHRIFEPFFTTKAVGQGTGLGLAICRDIVRSCGGEISVESELGQGSSFRVSLPLAESAAPPPPEVPARLSATKRARILFVDDEVMLGIAAQRFLAPVHDVLAVSSGRQALERLAAEQFNLIFCDLLMPEMTGMEFYSVLMRDRPDCAERVVFLTGGAFTPEARDFLERVPNPRLEKPLNFELLETQIAQLLSAQLPSQDVRARSPDASKDQAQALP